MSDETVPDELKRQEMEAYIFEKLDRRRNEKSSQYAQKLVEREEQNKDSQVRKCHYKTIDHFQIT
jgi:hypothetical protein